MEKIKIIFVFILFFCSFGVFAQNLTEAEYFFDTDPGIGNGTPVSFTADDTINFVFDASISGLSDGFHSLFIRFKDDNNHWSLYAGRRFYIQPEVITPAYSEEINYAEYFFDTDPGIGNGTTVGFTVDDTVNFVFDASISGLTEGIHSIFVRFKDDNNFGSLYEGRTFYVQPEIETQPSVTLVAMEYFIGDDPGLGNGTSLSVSQGDTINGQFDIVTNGKNAGTYTLSLRVKDADGIWSITEADTFKIVDCDFPEQPDLPVGTIQLCKNSDNSEYITNYLADTITYDWQILPVEAGTISGTDTVGTVDWDEDFTGMAQIFVNADNGCLTGPTSDTLEVNVYPFPVADAFPDTTICKGESVELVATGGTGYLWSTEETNDTISVIPEETTNYSVKVTQNGCSDSADVTVTVNPVYLIQEAETICEDDSLLWEGTYYLEAGTYQVVYNSVTGCDSIQELTLNVSPDYLFQEEKSICEGDSVLWHGEYYSVAGSYYDNNETVSGCDSIYQLDLIVKLLPVASFTFTSNELEATFTNTSVNASSYLWDFGDSNTETAENPVYTYASSGEYSVVLTAYNNYCGEATDTQSVSITTGIGFIEFGNLVKIYPNPSTGKLYLEIENLQNNNLFIKIVNVNGQVIYTKNVLTKPIEEIDLTNYAKGIYFIQVKSDKYFKTEKLIIE